MVMFSRKLPSPAPPLKESAAAALPSAPGLLAAVVRAGDVLHSMRTRIADSGGALPTVVGYTGYGSTGWVRVLARVVLSRSTSASPRGKVRGWQSFTSVPVRNSEVQVRIGDASYTLHADAGGLVDVVLECSLEPGWHTITLTAPGSVPAEARIQVVDPATTFGIVSDIDDTVMVTALPRPLLALWNTLVLSERARTPTPGMSVLYDRVLAHNPGTPLVYLSTGAWNVAPALTRFLARNLYPDGTLLLTDWGPAKQHWFRSGRDHKRNNLARLAQEFPHIRWLLVGDDGQHDPEIYAEFARSHPAQTAAIAIRQLSPSEALLAGGRNAEDAGTANLDGVEKVSAPDGAGLAQQLQQLGFL